MADYVLKDFNLKICEGSPYRDNIRFDVIGIKRNKRIIRIIEVKTSRQDFLQDNKWQKYLKYCTHFAFACPKGIIKSKEIPKGVGLIEVSTMKNLYGKEILKHEYIKKCSKLHKVTDKNYMKLLEGLIVRMMSGKYENGRKND